MTAGVTREQAASPRVGGAARMVGLGNLARQSAAHLRPGDGSVWTSDLGIGVAAPARRRHALPL
jgi:hypothetical protein